jgi:LysM repeat protein
MNTPNPLIPQGSLPDSRGKSHVRIAVFTIIAIHVVLLGALLMAGCKKTNTDSAANTPGNPPDNAEIPPYQADSNAPPVAPPDNNAVTPPPSNLGQNSVTPPPTAPAVPPSLPTNPAPAVQPPVSPAPVETAVATGNATEHTIVKGDSYSTIAKRYHTTVKAITAANPGVQPSRLKIGQKINIPAPSASAPSASGTPSAATPDGTSSGGETVHVVKSNDTLWGLAKKYGVSQNAIKSANGMKTGSLRVGQKIKIPAKSSGATTPAPAPAPAPEPAPVTPAGNPVQ